MKKVLTLLSVALLTFSVCLTSCTDNQRAKNFGGTETINLPAGEKIVNCTWKEDHLWYLTEPMSSKDSARTLTFHEKSIWGVLQGTVIFKESK